MKKTIKKSEIAGMIAAPVIAFQIRMFTQSWIVRLTEPILDGNGDLAGFLVLIVIAIAVPSFLAVLAASLAQSRRFRIVNGFLAVFRIFPFDVVRAFSGVTEPGAILPVSMILSASLLSSWFAIRLATSRNMPEAAPAAEGTDPPPLEKVPVPSRFLTFLALMAIPFMILVLTASIFITTGVAALGWALLELFGYTPIAFLVGLAAGPLAALWGVLKTSWIIIRPPPAEVPAIRLDLEGRPGLASAVADAAREVGTKSPDHVLLHLEPVFFVTQGRYKLLDREVSGRVLGLGAPLLRDIPPLRLRAILAHEFSHFAGGDVLYSGIVAPVYRGIGSALEVITNLRASTSLGAIAYILQLPSVLFLIAFLEYFRTIDAALDRDRELRADRKAAELFGKNAVADTLQEISIGAVEFGNAVRETRPETPAGLLAAVRGAIAADPEARRKALETLEATVPDAFDSHPGIRARIAALPDYPGTFASGDYRVTESLEDEERRLSELAVRALGIPLAGQEPEEESDGESEAEEYAADPDPGSVG